MAKQWLKFPHADKAYAYDGAALKKHWDRLHRGDGEPFRKDTAVQDAWRHYHAGEFQRAVEAGIGAGGAGINAAIKAQAIYANYVEKADSRSSKKRPSGPPSAARARPRIRTRTTSTRTPSVATGRASPWSRRWRRDSAARSRMR